MKIVKVLLSGYYMLLLDGMYIYFDIFEYCDGCVILVIGNEIVGFIW